MSRATAILKLLDDDDAHVRDELREHLRDDPALLETVWARARDHGDPPESLRRLVLEHDGAELVHRFRAPETDLETGAWLLTELEQPRGEASETGRPMLDALADRLPPGSDGLGIARFLCRDLGFSGDRVDYHAPANSMLDRVLERRCGLPITLTVLWILVCRRRRIEARALTLPGHVVGCWSGGHLDLFEGGVAIGEDEIDRMCLASGFVDPERFLTPVSDRLLLQRMARNLVYAYRKRDDDQRARLAAAMAL